MEEGGEELGLGQRGAVCPGALYLGPRMALVAVRVNSDQPGAQAGASQLGVVWRQSCEQHPLVLVATGSLRPRHQVTAAFISKVLKQRIKSL